MLNLARRPFVNRRPLRRLTAILWVAAAGLCLVNLILFWSYFSGSGEARERLQALEQEESALRADLEELRDSFARIDLEDQNQQVRFLNQLLRERTFPWSRLFEDLEEVLPIAVRIERLAPGGLDRDQLDDEIRSLDTEQWIRIDLGGYARSPEDLLTLVEALFEHPSFASPNLLNESLSRTGETQYRLGVDYRVEYQSQSPTEVEITRADGEAGDEGSEESSPMEVVDSEPSVQTGAPLAEGVEAQAATATTAEPNPGAPVPSQTRADERIAVTVSEQSGSSSATRRRPPPTPEDDEETRAPSDSRSSGAEPTQRFAVQPTRGAAAESAGGDDRRLDSSDLPRPPRSRGPQTPQRSGSGRDGRSNPSPSPDGRDGRGGRDTGGGDGDDRFPVRDASGTGGGAA